MAKVVIINANHPHAGEKAVIKTENGNVIMKNILGKEKFEVELLDCKHGVNGCFVGKEEVRVID